MICVYLAGGITEEMFFPEELDVVPLENYQQAKMSTKKARDIVIKYLLDKNAEIDN